MEQSGMHFIENGNGDVAVIFLHYFGGSGATWEAVMASLADKVRCIALDLRGFGFSQKPAEALSVDDYADDVLQLIAELGLTRYMLVGHSMGGKIALAFAARKPSGLQSLVLPDPSTPTPEPMDDAAREELCDMFGDKEMIAAHLRKICAHPLSEDVIDREVAHHLQISRTAWNGWIVEGTREDISGRTGDIEVPVLVLGGDADKTFTKAVLQKEIVARLANARLEMIADAGHLLPLEKGDFVVTRMREWLFNNYT